MFAVGQPCKETLRIIIYLASKDMCSDTVALHQEPALQLKTFFVVTPISKKKPTV